MESKITTDGIGKIYNPKPKSKMIVGDLTIYHQNKKFNWLNKLMFKIFFGIKIEDYKEKE